MRKTPIQSKPMYIAVDDPYYESAIGEMITKQRAFLELEKHGIEDYSEFLDDVGDKLEYLATDVLDWLGY